MGVRTLGSGDEEVSRRACRRFGHAGDLDPGVFLARPEALLLVAEDGPELVGWAYGHELVHPHGERTMLLYALDVTEDARRQGHGTALVTSFVEHARRRGCTEVWVLTDDENQAGLATYAASGGQREPDSPVMFVWNHTDGRGA